MIKTSPERNAKLFYLFEEVKTTPERKNRGRQDPSGDSVSDLINGVRSGGPLVRVRVGLIMACVSHVRK